MPVQTITHTFSAVVGSGGTASVNKTIIVDNIAVLFVKVEPSILGGSHTFEIFQKDTLLAADLSYKASGFSGDFIDPIEDVSGTPTERTEGFVTAYQDDDSTLELHIRITNDDTSTKNFDITIRYLSIVGDIDIAGTPVNNQIAVWTDSNTLEGDANLTWDASLLNITGALTVSGAIIFTTALTVAQGGTGVATLTDGGILIGAGTGPITALGVAANGQIPIGDGTTAPVLAVILGTANEVSITNGAGSIQIGLPTNVTIAGALTVSGVGPHAIGGATVADQGLSIIGTLGAGVSHGTHFNQSVTPATGEDAYVVRVTGTLTEFSSGVHSLLAGLRIDAPTVTAGVATVTDAATFVIGGEINASGARNHALLVLAGQSRFGAVGTNDGHVHILSPSASTNALVVEMPTGATFSIQRWHYDGADAGTFFSNATKTEFALSDRDFGNNVAGCSIAINRNTNTGAEGGAAPTLKLQEGTGTARFIWHDDTGDLRTHTAAPTGTTGTPTVSDTAGIEVGAQTSWHELKQNIVEFTNYQAALDKIITTPLYSFDHKSDHYESAYVIKKSGVWYSHNDKWGQIPSLKIREIFGTHAGAIKALEARIKILEAL